MKLIQLLGDLILESLPKGGDCFDSAYNYMIENGRLSDVRLVHGFVSGKANLKDIGLLMRGVKRAKK